MKKNVFVYGCCSALLASGMDYVTMLEQSGKYNFDSHCSYGYTILNAMIDFRYFIKRRDKRTYFILHLGAGECFTYPVEFFKGWLLDNVNMGYGDFSSFAQVKDLQQEFVRIIDPDNFRIFYKRTLQGLGNINKIAIGLARPTSSELKIAQALEYNAIIEEVSRGTNTAFIDLWEFLAEQDSHLTIGAHLELYNRLTGIIGD